MERGGKLCGPALTVRTAPGDNLLIHKAIDLAQPGDVIVVGGTVVHPGDILVGDADGLVVVAPSQAEAVLAAVRALLAKEKALLENIACGNVGRRWMDETLAAKGCAP